MMPSNSKKNRNAGKNKCGDVFICSKDILSMICDICGDNCYTLEAFETHILQEDHAPMQLTTRIKREVEDCNDSVIDIKTEATTKQTYENQRFSRQTSILHVIGKPQDLTANNTKCGEIFYFIEDKFSLVCDKCSENYYALEAFGVHILHDHPATSNDVVSIKMGDPDADNSPLSQTDILHIKRETIDYPDFVSINIKEEHDSIDISDALISEANESNQSGEDTIEVTKHKKSFKCSFCDKIFSNIRDRDDHENTHMGRRPYECCMCHKVFTSLRSLKTHIRLHSTDLPHKCLVCDRRFIKRIALDHHFREKHLPLSDPRRFFPCKDCGKIFKTYSNMCRHVHTQHKPTKTGTFICDYCQKIFPTRSKIVRHVLHHVVKDTKHKCRFCDKMFADKYYHKMHESRHIAPRPDEMPQCQLCFKSFKYMRGLRRHMKNIHTDGRKTRGNKIKIEKHTQKTQRPHQCKICKRILTTSSGLKDHIKIHTNDRPHKCLLCAVSFIKPVTLLIHNREHHLPETDPRRYFSCNRCDTKFLTHSKLRYHIISTHTNPSSLYTCDYCQKQYRFRRELVSHIIEHFPKVIYKCSVCDKKFKNEISRDEHKNTHGGGSNAKCQCQFCPNSYMHRSSLWRHINIAHTK